MNPTPVAASRQLNPAAAIEPGAPKPTRRRLTIVLLVLLLIVVGGVVAVRGSLDPGPAVAGVTNVTLRDFAFGPAAIEVPAGSTVTWQWADGEQHNVVGDGFASPLQTEGEFARIFAAPGVYPYRCTLHLLMRGEVVVTGKSGHAPVVSEGRSW